MRSSIELGALGPMGGSLRGLLVALSLGASLGLISACITPTLPDDDDDTSVSDDDDDTAGDDDDDDSVGDDDDDSGDDDDDDDDTSGLQDDDLGYQCDIEFPPLPTAPPVERSFYALPTANGFISSTYAIDLNNVPVTHADGGSGTFSPSHRLYTLTDHVMAQPSPTEWTRDLMYDAYLGVRIDSFGQWLSEIPEISADYVPGTGIIRLVQQVKALEIETYIFAPFHGDNYSLVILARATNRGAAPLSADIYSLMNLHSGGEGNASGEEVSLVGSRGVLETRGDDRLYYYGLNAPVARSAGPPDHPDNPYGRLQTGQNLTGSGTSGDDVAVGLQWQLGLTSGGQLAADATEWQGMVIGLNGNGESSAALMARIESFVAGRSPEAMLAAEEAFWADYHAVETPPAAASEEELAVYRQSTAVLKMAQVREPGPAYGQILASMPPGGWNISWPRDAAYAIAALARAGHHEEAQAALDFQLNGDSGEFASWIGLEDYGISLCRIYGDGTEESDGATCPDGSDAGPNIELDNLGLFLWAWEETAAASGDSAWIAETLPAVRSGVADPLVQTIADNDLLLADSSIWERHWWECFPNGRKQFTYSAINAVNGLSLLADRAGEPGYQSAAERVRGGILSETTFEESFSGEACPVIASAPEEICDFCGPYDASVVEAINFGVVRPESALAKGTMRAFMSHLQMSNGSPGFLRADDGSGTTNPFPWYDDQEWVVMDLRIVTALALMGEALDDDSLRGSARTLLDWVTAHATVNANLIGELLSDGVYTGEDEHDHWNPGRDDGYEYQGSVPMAGFGPGAYLLALDAIYGE